MPGHQRNCLAPRGWVVFAFGLAIFAAPFAAGAALLSQAGRAEEIDATPAPLGAIFVRPMSDTESLYCADGYPDTLCRRDQISCPPPLLDVVVDADAIYLSVTRDWIEPVRITRDGGERERLAEAMQRLHRHDIFAERNDVRVAAGGRAGSGVTLDDLVGVIDVARDAGFVGPQLYPVEWLHPTGPARRSTTEFDPRDRHWP